MEKEFPLYTIDFNVFFDTKTVFSKNHLNGGHRLAYIGNIGCIVGYITDAKKPTVFGDRYKNLAIGVASSEYDLTKSRHGNIFYEKSVLRNIALARAMFEPLYTCGIYDKFDSENSVFDWLKIHNPEYLINNKSCRMMLRYIDGRDDYLHYSSHIVWEKYLNKTNH